MSTLVRNRSLRGECQLDFTVVHRQASIEDPTSTIASTLPRLCLFRCARRSEVQWSPWQQSLHQLKMDAWPWNKRWNDFASGPSRSSGSSWITCPEVSRCSAGATIMLQQHRRSRATTRLSGPAGDRSVQREAVAGCSERLALPTTVRS